MPVGKVSFVPNAAVPTTLSVPLAGLIANVVTSPVPFVPPVSFTTNTNCPTRTQLTVILVILEVATVPDPLVTVHTSAGADGWVSTVAAYGFPLCKAVGKVNVVALAGTVKLSPALSCSTRPLEVSPLMLPPTL